MVKSKPADNPPSFEKSMAELESIVQNMERDDLPLEDALSHYQKGIELLRQCQSTLNAAEQKIRMLEDGQLIELPQGDENA